MCELGERGFGWGLGLGWGWGLWWGWFSELDDGVGVDLAE